MTAFNHKKKQRAWQFVFSTTRLSADPGSGKTSSHHIHETSLHKAIMNSAGTAGIIKRVTSYSMRHCFAKHVIIKGGQAIRSPHNAL
jgi:integrase